MRANTRKHIAMASAGIAAALFTASLAAPQAAFADNAASPVKETFALISDTHIGAGTTVESDFKLALKNAKKMSNLVAVINAGDVTNVGGEKEYKRYLSLWKESKISAAMIQVVGNHDNAAGGYQKWLTKRGYKGYTKDTGVNLFKKILNNGQVNTVTEFNNANVIAFGQGEKQSGGVYPDATVSWLEKQVRAAQRAGKMAIVVTHYAPWHGTDDQFKRIPKNLDRIVSICQSYPNVIYVCGHEHQYEQDKVHFKAHYTYETHKEAAKFHYKRTGINTSSSKYPIHLLCLNSTSRVKGVDSTTPYKGRYVWLYGLTVGDDGNISFVQHNLSKNTKKTTKFTQMKSDVKVKVSNTGTTEPVRIKIRFSDKKAHDGVKDGAVVKLTPSKTLTIRSIPAGVLVGAKALDDCYAKDKPEGFTYAEAGKSARTITVAYKDAERIAIGTPENGNAENRESDGNKDIGPAIAIDPATGKEITSPTGFSNENGNSQPESDDAGNAAPDNTSNANGNTGK